MIPLSLGPKTLKIGGLLSLDDIENFETFSEELALWWGDLAVTSVDAGTACQMAIRLDLQGTGCQSSMLFIRPLTTFQA